MQFSTHCVFHVMCNECIGYRNISLLSMINQSPRHSLTRHDKIKEKGKPHFIILIDVSKKNIKIEKDELNKYQIHMTKRESNYFK